MKIKRWLSYLAVLIFGILIGRFLIPKPMEVVPLERLEVQIEMMEEVSRLMNVLMDEHEECVEFNEGAIQ